MLSLKKYKNFNAILFFHEDMDGVVSAIIFKEYLRKYNIKVIKFVPIQYGDRWMFVSIKKWKEENNIESDKTIFILTDFSNGFVNVEIHTDHHEKQYVADKYQTYFDSEKKSNAEMLNNISPFPIMQEDEIKYVNMIDAAQYEKYGLNPENLLKVVFRYDKNKNYKENKMYLALVINNLIAIYKEKMIEEQNFLSLLVTLAKPSLLSIYNTAIYLLKLMNPSDYRKILRMEEEMFLKYLEDVNQLAKKYPELVEINNYNDFFKALQKAENSMFITKEKVVIVMNNIKELWQEIDGKFQKVYNSFRYAPFSAYPESIAVIKIFEDLGRIQISYNSWNKNIEKIRENLDLSSMKENVFKRLTEAIFQNQYIKIGNLLSVLFSEKKISKQSDLTNFTVNNILDFLKSIKSILKIKKGTDNTVVFQFNEKIKGKTISEFHKILNEWKDKLNNLIFYLKDYCKLMSGGHKQIYNYEISPIQKKELASCDIFFPPDYMIEAGYIVYDELKKRLENEYSEFI